MVAEFAANPSDLQVFLTLTWFYGVLHQFNAVVAVIRVFCG